MNAVLSSFHFIRPEYLLLMPLVIGLWWLWQRRSDPLRGWREQMDPVLLEALSVGRKSANAWPRPLAAHWLAARGGRCRRSDLASGAKPIRR